MRTSYQESFHGVPSNYPLKSPSPDMKAKNTLPQTLSPYGSNLKKNSHQFSPLSYSTKNKSYSEYATLPHFNQQFSQTTEAKIQKMFSNTKNNSTHQKQYSSTHAKGHYVFQMPQQIYQNMQENKRDFMMTGKKIQYNQSQSYQSSTPLKNKNNELLKTIQEKDMIISELKDMINLMTQNGKHLKMSHQAYHEQQYEKMKNNVKILTIQNQKLSQVIDKLNQKNQHLTKIKQNTSHVNKQKSQHQKVQFMSERSAKSEEDESNKKITQFQTQINHLKQILQQKQTQYEKQIHQLTKNNQNLALECRFFENQKEKYSKQNQRLINLLRLKDKEKQTCYNNYSYFDKSQYESSSQNNLQKIKGSSQANKESTSTRLSIQKIKEQYEENLKLYKQNVYNQVYMMFDTINVTLEEINQKINVMEQRIIDMQRFRDSWKSRVRSHLTSIEENDEEIKKSAIYIEDAPSSSRLGQQSRKSKQVLSVILEQSRRDNEKLQTQISHLKKQVQYYKQSLEQRLQIKTSQSQQELTLSYEKRIRQLEDLVDQLREQKQTIYNQLSQTKMQNIKKQQYHHSAKLTTISQDQHQLNDLKQQLSILTQQLQSKQIQQHQFLQKIKTLQQTQNIREKSLLQEIQRFQSLIKQTQNQFKSTKQQYQQQIDSLNQEMQIRKNQDIKNQQQIVLLKQHNEQLSQKISFLEQNSAKHLLNQQNLHQIQSLLKSFNLTSNNQDFYLSIKSYVEDLENQVHNKTQDRNQLIKINENQNLKILQLQENNIDLTQKVVCLQQKLKIYKLQFEKSKQFYSKFLESDNDEQQKLSSKENKNKAKSKIDDLLNSQNRKITQLIQSIAELSNNGFKNIQMENYQ